ncbi:hypothetical protein [uncultured Bacteroides sp.]|nr:hypothetical protein [uncultured Bacteroides sp.]
MTKVVYQIFTTVEGNFSLVMKQGLYGSRLIENHTIPARLLLLFADNYGR